MQCKSSHWLVCTREQIRKLVLINPRGHSDRSEFARSLYPVCMGLYFAPKVFREKEKKENGSVSKSPLRVYSWPEERRQYRVHFRIFAFQCHTCRGYNGNIDRQSQITNAFCGEQKESFLTEKSCGFRFFHFLPLSVAFPLAEYPEGFRSGHFLAILMRSLVTDSTARFCFKELSALGLF